MRVRHRVPGPDQLPQTGIGPGRRLEMPPLLICEVTARVYSTTTLLYNYDDKPSLRCHLVVGRGWTNTTDSFKDHTPLSAPAEAAVFVYLRTSCPVEPSRGFTAKRATREESDVRDIVEVKRGS